jgi:hypothetical protein
MANPPRQKGTKWETALLEPLRRLFGGRVERSSLSGINDYGDFINVPFLVEAKSTLKPLFQQWARTCEKKANKAWVIIWKGDTRTKTGNGPFVLMSIELFELLTEYALSDRTFLRPAVDVLRDDCVTELGGKR